MFKNFSSSTNFKLKKYKSSKEISKHLRLIIIFFKCLSEIKLITLFHQIYLIDEFIFCRKNSMVLHFKCSKLLPNTFFSRKLKLFKKYLFINNYKITTNLNPFIIILSLLRQRESTFFANIYPDSFFYG